MMIKPATRLWVNPLTEATDASPRLPLADAQANIYGGDQ
jgi:hypothetical protein